MGYHKISDPEPRRHSRKIFFINPEKYWTDTSCLHFWSDLDQNCENDAFLTGKLWAIPLSYEVLEPTIRFAMLELCGIPILGVIRAV